MERAVAKKGGDWCYPKIADDPRYYMGGTPVYTLSNGESACLIGAALNELGKSVSAWDTRSATAVLSSTFGVTDKTLVAAARMAQCHQDSHRPWGEALQVYKMALRMKITYVDSYSYAQVLLAAGLPCVEPRRTEVATKTYATALKKMADDIQAITKTLDEQIAPVFAEVCKPANSITSVSPSMFAESVPMYTWGGQAVLYKKDHALTA